MSVSSMLSFEAYAEDYALNYSLGAITDNNDTQLDGTIAAGKAYYSTRADKDTYASSGASASAKGISLPLDVTPTGINSVVAEGTNVKNQNAYNIAGQRIGKDYKGLVIINGKKYIRK